jgi:low affinity Fe/Cu permease
MNIENKDTILMTVGAVSSLAMGLCYISLFIIYGALLSFDSNWTVIERVAYLIDNPMLTKATYLVGYILFACLLCVCTQALHRRLKSSSAHLLNTASLFALFWALVLLCTGMVGLTSFEMMSDLMPVDKAALVITNDTLLEGFGLSGIVWFFWLAYLMFKHR